MSNGPDGLIAPIIRSITHAPDQTTGRPRLIHWDFDLAAPGRYNLTSE
jgi:hypothetical protein